MEVYNLTYKPFGESAILVEWPKKISKKILNDIRLFVQKIENYKSKEILELSYVYNSLLINYNPEIFTYTDLKHSLEILYNGDFKYIKDKKKLWEIPVCYDEEFGIDLSFLAFEKSSSVEEIISLHSKENYTVYGIGFLPGFLYLGGLSKKLHFPRRALPRLEVSKGSVAIGGSQTGVYPKNSPGGWHIIGKTPLSFFDVNNEIPCDINPGDEIKFIKVTKEEYEEIKIKNELGKYQLKPRFI